MQIFRVRVFAYKHTCITHYFIADYGWQALAAGVQRVIENESMHAEEIANGDYETVTDRMGIPLFSMCGLTETQALFGRQLDMMRSEVKRLGM